MSLAKEFHSLPPEQRRFVHISLCESALAKWLEYIEACGPIQYTETVCGTRQVVDGDLPRRALDAVRKGWDNDHLADMYLEPIVSMQDGDLEFPDAIEYAYYAIYNLYQKYIDNQAIDDWLIVNQAISAEVDENMWSPLLADAIELAVSRKRRRQDRRRSGFCRRK